MAGTGSERRKINGLRRKQFEVDFGAIVDMYEKKISYEQAVANQVKELREERESGNE